jgi:hypothetical protein
MTEPVSDQQPLSRQKEAEFKVLRRFVEVYCRKHHGAARGEMCADCAELLAYGLARLVKCPYDPKPSCKNCPVHCYRPDMRRRMREVMRFSGRYMIKHGRLDWVVRYFSRPSKPRR